MPAYYIEKNNTKCELGTRDSDTTINNSLNSGCSIKLATAGFYQEPARNDLFIKWSGYSNNIFKKSDNTETIVPWGTTASESGYYIKNKKFLAGCTNCPIPSRAGELNTWTNAGPSKFTKFIEVPYDTAAFTTTTLSYDATTKVISATGSATFSAPAGNSVIILDIQAPGGRGGWGEGRRGVLEIGGGNTGGGGGGGGAFCTLLVDMAVVKSFIIQSNDSGVVLRDNYTNHSEFLTVRRGQSGQNGTFGGDGVGDGTYGGGATGGGGGNGGTVTYSGAQGIYLLDSVSGKAGGTGEAAIWVSSYQKSGSNGASLAHTFAPGPLTSSLTHTKSGGTYSDSLKKYDYCTGGGGGASACGSGGDGRGYSSDATSAGTPAVITWPVPQGYGSGGGGGSGYFTVGQGGGDSGSTVGVPGAAGGIVMYI